MQAPMYILHVGRIKQLIGPPKALIKNILVQRKVNLHLPNPQFPKHKRKANIKSGQKLECQ